MPQAPLASRQVSAVLHALAGGATNAEAARAGKCSTASVDRIKRAERARNGGYPRLVPEPAASSPPPPDPPPAEEDEDDLDDPGPWDSCADLPFTQWARAEGLCVVDAAADVLTEPDNHPDAPDPSLWDLFEAAAHPGELYRLARGAVVHAREAVEVLEAALVQAREEAAREGERSAVTTTAIPSDSP